MIAHVIVHGSAIRFRLVSWPLFESRAICEPGERAASAESYAERLRGGID